MSTAGAAPITRHAAWITLERRLRVRCLLGSLRLGLIGATVGIALAATLGKLLVLDGWVTAALIWSGLAVGVAMLARVPRWPNARAVALAADELGLQERISSSLEALRLGHPAAALLERDARHALARLRPEQYPLVPEPRAWRGLAALALGTAILVAAPLPSIGDRARQAEEARAVLAARRALERPSADVVRLSPVAPVAAAAADELRRLDSELSEVSTVDIAAQRMETAQERLASLARAEEFAWRRALDTMARQWARDPELQNLARALMAHDQRAVEQAAAELAARGEELSADDLQRLSVGLQAGANAARDVPEVAGALRQLASEAGATGPDGPAATAERIGDALEEGAARAAGLDATQRAVAAVGSARASLGATARGATGRGQAARGSSSGATGSQAGASGSTATGAAGQSRTGAGQSSGQGTGQGTAASGQGTGSQTGASQASGTGSAGAGRGVSGASGTGSGSGTGGSGTGAGAGAGTGSSGASENSATGGGTGAAGGARGDPGPSEIAGNAPLGSPRLMGGGAGPDVAVAGDANAATGDLVQLPDSPLELGPLRPYQSVYGEYEEHARHSLAQQPLPPALEALVQRYFSAIDPAAGSGR